ncbi:MAG: hypothetical protein NTW79_01000 [Candidatus Berkelbacteria bacterium]|nr:hypothetical protein [Candidatus Berkelbacteria bacterium]
MKTWLKILITVILTTAIVGGGTYYYMSRKATRDKNNLQTQIDDLNKQVATLKTATTAATPATVADAWKNYANTTYGFTLTFNDLWKGATIISGTKTDPNAVDELYLWVPTTDKTWQTTKAGYWYPIIISVYTPDNWNTVQNQAIEGAPTFLGQTASYVFGYNQSQADPKDGAAIFANITALMKTFVLTK